MPIFKFLQNTYHLKRRGSLQVPKNFGGKSSKKFWGRRWWEKINDRFYCSKYENFGSKSDFGIKNMQILDQNRIFSLKNDHILSPKPKFVYEKLLFFIDIVDLTVDGLLPPNTGLTNGYSKTELLPFEKYQPLIEFGQDTFSLFKQVRDCPSQLVTRMNVSWIFEFKK